MDPQAKRVKAADASAAAGSNNTGQQEELAPYEYDTQRPKDGTVCPYLDTINRKLLDFDLNKQCSVSLSNQNVYACLVCGKYYQGRGRTTPAFFHALETDHRVYINLNTEKIYCLPDNYEVIDASLHDIQYNLHPTFVPRDLQALDNNTAMSHALDGTDYLPGLIGLNNIRSTDWFNVVIQSLVRIPNIRNFFSIEANYASCKSQLVQEFGALVRKLWNGRRFIGHVSPHELLQAATTASDKKFRIGVQSDPVQFLSWLLNTLHRDLGGTKKRNSSIIYQTFQGEIQVEKTLSPEQIEARKAERKKKRADEEAAAAAEGIVRPPQTPAALAAAAAAEQAAVAADETPTLSRIPFLTLSLKLPKAPLFKDEQDRTLIPQVPIYDLLSQYDGFQADVAPDGSTRRMKLTRLPRYLIIYVTRFQENNWFVEKNPTLVNFPIRNLDLKPCLLEEETKSEQDYAKESISKLKEECAKLKLDVSGAVQKDELISKLVEYHENKKTQQPTRYDLIGNICHDGKPEKGTYRMHTVHKPTNTWYEVQDLHVWSTETMPQLVALSEMYIQVYERQKN